jgi:hypothetical protein
MTRIRVPSFVMRDLELEHVHALPTGARKRAGMKTTCASCGGQINDEMFFAGFATGHPNRMFHWGCLDEISQDMCKWGECQKCGMSVVLGDGHILNGDWIHARCDAARQQAQH